MTKITINDSPNKIKRKSKKCDNCGMKRLLINEFDVNLCRPCYRSKYTNESNHWIDVVYCEVCNHLMSEDDYKTCSGCNKAVGHCCGILYHCQSTECECVNCFNGCCTECNEPLKPLKRYYLSDDSLDGQPMCIRCREKIEAEMNE